MFCLRVKSSDMSKFNSNSPIALGLLLYFMYSLPLVAQEIAQQPVPVAESDTFASFRVSPTSVLSEAVAPFLEIARKQEATDFQGQIVEEVLDFNLGMQITPFQNGKIEVGAWESKTLEMPGSNFRGEPEAVFSQLHIESLGAGDLGIDEPLLGINAEGKGFDVGASYAWDSSRFGQFTLSAKASYVSDFQNTGSALELFSEDLIGNSDRLVNSELQSSLMLTWEFGNHTASAITKHFNAFKDINELNIEEIHALVDNIATVDFQYGYSLETGNNDRAIISFGIRNIFNERTARILNSATRILDQNGRVAYGSIKYQF
jgi:hypothetical protein